MKVARRKRQSWWFCYVPLERRAEEEEGERDLDRLGPRQEEAGEAQRALVKTDVRAGPQEAVGEGEERLALKERLTGRRLWREMAD